MSEQINKLVPNLTPEQINHLIEAHERQRKQNKEWVEANKDKVRQYHREYFHKTIKNSDKYKEHLQSEKRKETVKRSYLKRKEQLKNALIQKDKTA
jgi:adenylosuccinate lyase